jgi:hypothetical protein
MSDEPIRSELFSVERLESHADSLAAAQRVLERPSRGRPVLARLSENAKVLDEAYRVIADTTRDGRPLRPYVLRHDPDGWSLTAAGAAFRTTKDLPAADAAGAQEWATAQLRDAGVNVTGWASREDQAAGPGYLATVGRRVRR